MKAISLLFKKAAVLTVVGFLAMDGVISAHAASVSYFMDQSNALADGVNYLQVSIDDEGDAGEVNFTVDVFESVLTPGSNFGIQLFGFNGPDLSGATLELPSGWSYVGSQNISEFGVFLNVISGNGGSRQDPLAFLIGGVGNDTIASYAASNAGGEFFVAHVADFSNFGATTSAFFAGSSTAPVPLPAAVWLFGSGLLGLIGFARLKNKLN